MLEKRATSLSQHDIGQYSVLPSCGDLNGKIRYDMPGQPTPIWVSQTRTGGGHERRQRFIPLPGFTAPSTYVATRALHRVLDTPQLMVARQTSKLGKNSLQRCETVVSER